jgi:hypothetical protein
LKGGEKYMKKEWQQPVLEVLEVKMTELGSDGGHTDATFPQNTPTEDLKFS